MSGNSSLFGACWSFFVVKSDRDEPVGQLALTLSRNDRLRKRFAASPRMRATTCEASRKLK